ncbi:unnamed protein product [Musa textilis]
MKKHCRLIARTDFPMTEKHKGLGDSHFLSIHLDMSPHLSKYYCSPRKIDDEEVATTTTNSSSVWIVWKKSSMGFHGTDGFSIYDSMGRLAFRVDNYPRERKCVAGELLLMDGNGYKAVVTLRPQGCDRRLGFRGEDGRETDCRSTHVFDIRRRSVLQSCDEGEVFMISEPKDVSEEETARSWTGMAMKWHE